MSRYDEDARIERFRHAVARISMEDLAEHRVVDGTTQVGRQRLLTARDRILATASNADGAPIVAGTAASVLHGNKWFDPDFTIELLHPISGSSKHGEGRKTRRYMVAESDYIEIEGVRVTSPVRTAFDVGRIPPEWRGLGYLDALHRATGFSVPALMRYIERHRGWRHIRQLRAIAPLVNGSAESPPESWVRLLMIRGDLPSPDVQIQVQDESGQIIARIDLGYRAVKIGIEYDGEEFHSGRMQRERDARRDERLESLGWKMIRIDAERMREEPWLILAEIETALRARGYY